MGRFYEWEPFAEGKNRPSPVCRNYFCLLFQLYCLQVDAGGIGHPDQNGNRGENMTPGQRRACRGLHQRLSSSGDPWIISQMGEALIEQRESEEAGWAGQDRAWGVWVGAGVQTEVMRSEWNGVPLFLDFCCLGWCDGLRKLQKCSVNICLTFLVRREEAHMLFPKMKCDRQALSIDQGSFCFKMTEDLILVELISAALGPGTIYLCSYPDVSMGFGLRSVKFGAVSFHHKESRLQSFAGL